MRRHLVAKVLLAAALAVGGACSSGDGAPNDGTAGSASGGTTASGGGTVGGTAGSTGGAATGGQTTGGVGGITATGGTAEQTAGHSGAGGAATGGHPSGGTGGSALSGTGGGGSSGAAATAGSRATGGTGGTVAYAPCPTNGSACKILPFGDSITRGAKSTDDGGYRSPLFKLIVAAKQKATFVGSAANGPTQVSGQPFPRMHEGHAGWTIDPGYNMLSSSYSGISKLVPSPALDANPNIILLMIGTNDLFARDTAGMATRLEALLDKVAQNAPNALIVLAQLTPLGHDDPNLTAYNAKIPGIVQSHAAKGQRIIGVDMSKLPTSELTDGTHPTDQGYAYMANIWYAAIKDLLPK